MMLQAQKHITKGSDHLQTKTHKFFNTYDTAGPIGTKWNLGSLFNPHQCCASFSPDIPPSDIRPHIPVHINNNYINSLIDSGASVSLVNRALAEQLIKAGLAKTVDSKVYIQDCHSNVQSTAGAILIPISIPDHNISGITIKLHITDNLSSEILLGCDSLAALGALIDFRTKEVIFSPEAAAAIRHSQHPLLMEAVASSQTAMIGSALRDHISKFTYAVSPTETLTIKSGDQRTFTVKLETDNNLQLKAGSVVLLQADGRNLEEPTAVTPTTFKNVQDNNKLSITVANISTTDTILERDTPIPGMIAQSMSAFHTPTKIEPGDMEIMSNIREAFEEAVNLDPTFMSRYETAAAEAALDPHKPTQDQARPDPEIFEFMRKTYKEAIKSIETASSLRPTGKPSGGRKHKPSEPCNPELKSILMDQLDLSGTDKAWRNKYRQLVLENYDVFSKDRYDLGNAQHFEHHIDLVHEGETPPFVKQFPIPVNDEPILEEMCRTLLTRGVLLPQHSPGNSPVFIVRKPGSQPRFVQDLRQSNALARADRYQILGLRESLIQIGKRKPEIFSTLDLSGAFWQLQLSEESRPWSAFTLPFLNIQVCWSRTPMGAKGATSSFSKFLHIAFKDMPSMDTFVDDMLTSAKCHEEMLVNLEQAFQILRTNNLKLNLKKCKLGYKEVSWLGYTINREGIKPDRSKVEKCRQMQPPVNQKEISSHLPFFQFNSQCIENFQGIAGPLIKLTTADSKWRSVKQDGPLPPEALKAWLQIKNMILEQPQIAFPDPSLPYQIFTDASGGTINSPGAIAAVLTQVHDGVTKPISYFSRRLRDAERLYDAFNCELLAVVSALDHWRNLLIGADIVCFSDQKPLSKMALKSAKTCNSLIRKIIEFDCQILHILGANNQVADYLSRFHRGPDDPEPLDDHRLNIQEDKAAKSLVPFPKQNPQGDTDQRDDTTQHNTSTINPPPALAGTAGLYDLSKHQDNVHKQKGKNIKAKNNEELVPSTQLFSLSSPITSSDNVISSTLRTALLAKEHRKLGLVGSKKRLEAHGISAAGIQDLHSKDLWQKLQYQDPILAILIDYVTTQKIPENSSDRQLVLNLGPKVVIEDGLLYYYGSYKRSPTSKKLMVPRELITPIISEAHDSCLGGHFAAETTISTIMTKYFWQTMAIDVSEHISKCKECYIAADRNGVKTRAQMKALPTPSRIGERVHVDLVGPLHNSLSDHKYIMSITDALSKWTVLVSLKDKTAESVAAGLINNWLLAVSPIENLQSDQGSEFCNSVVSAVAEYFKIKLHTTSAFNPKANGQAERVHRSLNHFLQIYSNQLGDDWITFLPALQYALNTKCHSSTGFTPWYIIYGRHAGANWRNYAGNSTRYGEDEATRKFNLIQYALNLVKDNDKEAKDAFIKAANKKFKERGFKKGDFVLFISHHPS